MQKLTFYKNVHFIGILGTSMRNLARFTMAFGICVTGSDIAYDGNLPSFLSEIKVKKRFCETDFLDTQLVVFTGAISSDDPEITLCKKLGIETVPRSQYLNALSEQFNTIICVAGTHGKTTTCGMIGKVLKVANLSPAVHMGGEYESFFPFSREYFVTEACEYKRSFLSLTPNVCLILNTEYDHPDCYSSEIEVKEAYLKFARKTDARGVVISDEPLSSGTFNVVIGRDVYPTNVINNDGYYTFTPVVNSQALSPITLRVPGYHNVKNALFCILTCKYLGVNYDYIKQGLEKFEGVHRRYTKLTKKCGEVIVDYAHHPTEIKAVIDTAKAGSRRVRVFFQPHTYSRTKAFFEGFVDALSAADIVYVVEEYPARETPDMGIDALTLYSEVKKYVDGGYLTLSEAKAKLEEPYDVTLVLGAGNISQITD